MTLEFVQNYLRENAFDLNATQPRLSLPILQRIHRKLQNGERFSDLKVADGMIINGHHRYLCLHVLGIEVETVPYVKSSATTVTPWNEVEIDTVDWDSPPPIDEEKIASEGAIDANLG